MGSTSKRLALGGSVPYVLGLCALATMLIPQLALQTFYQPAVRGVICGLLVYLVNTRTIRQGIWFALAMALVAWALDLEEGAVIGYLAGAGLVLAAMVGQDRGMLYGRIVVGCVLAGLVLVAGASGLMLWRKEFELARAVEFGFRSEIFTLLASLIGGVVGGYLSKR